MNIKIEVKGMVGAERFLAELDQNIANQAARALDKYAENRIDEMRSQAPVKTGYLRNNIRMNKPNPNSVQLNSWAPYSGYVNYGTSRMRPRPFFTDPLQKGKPILEKMLQQEIMFYIRSLASKYQNM